jgi:hypothetical protein
MSKCKHEGCSNEGITHRAFAQSGPEAILGGLCAEHGCCNCGDKPYGDAGWHGVLLCHECYQRIASGGVVSLSEKIARTAYQFGRMSVLGDTSGIDDDGRGM